MRTVQVWSGPLRGKVIRVGDDLGALTAEERRAVEIEDRAERIIRDEVYCLDSCLVGDLMKLGMTGDGSPDEFSYDNVSNLRPDPSDWTLEQCKEWLDDHGYGHPDPDPWGMSDKELLEYADRGDRTREEWVADVAEQIEMDDYAVSEWRDAVRDNADEAEIYEWYRVSSWLAGKLDEIGECVLDNAYGQWWGRCCTGQSHVMDGVFQRVAETLG